MESTLATIFRLIRLILGNIILFLDRLTTPTPISRTPIEQEKVDAQTTRLALYQYQLCPFCVKVRRAIRRLGLKIVLRDALHNEKYRRELISEGGQEQTPCLRITDDKGSVRWLYESSDIITYLEKSFGAPKT